MPLSTLDARMRSLETADFADIITGDGFPTGVEAAEGVFYYSQDWNLLCQNIDGATTWKAVNLVKSSLNVSNPPTDGELDAEFGAPATLPVNFGAIIDDNGTGANLWLVCAVDTKWGYTALTIAV